ncbi:RNA polymerase sigma factor [Nocardia goodfellowii]|uniref:DNA-directed RNA polymerase specialized sigma24 family protein n=1 Tax=Nocardia goodfellowii TaxID=882446 RepID=A0ABS4QEN4_9NOCA|nr:sigma-70 family RNA polymerase sigma factor [Nocardia goodfellowii]MBP2189549.1 DNA-directed RNA polymerase specialized sigma24 family protein [Nocardia goodfellowii]
MANDAQEPAAGRPGQLDPLIECAEHELFDVVSATGFRGPAWDVLADRLVRYGLVVLTAWLRSGHIFAETNALGRDLCPSVQERELVAVRLSEDLANDAVSAALASFQRKALAGNGWRKDGGASLSAYFVRACLYAFIDAFRKYRRTGELSATGIGTDPIVAGDYREPASGPDFTESVVNRAVLYTHLAQLTERDRNMVWGKASGYTAAEIAGLFDWPSAKAVERRWARLRLEYAWINRLAGKEQ